MSIIWKIPPKAEYIATSNIFDAPFGTISPGQYNYTADDTHENVEIDLGPRGMEPNVLYLIERMSIGGNVSELDYLASIAEFPRIRLTYHQGRGVIYPKTIPCVNYYDGQEVAAWALSEKGNNRLNITFMGIFGQTANMVGVDPLRINVSFSIYAIRAPQFITAYLDTLTNQSGQYLRGR
jgi:hypothetical protein